MSKTNLHVKGWLLMRYSKRDFDEQTLLNVIN